LDLKLSNYIFTAVLPIIILSALFINKLPHKLFIAFCIVYVFSSFLMSKEYQKYFDVKNNQRLIEFVQTNKDRTIYTDHHTAYGLYVNTETNDNHIKIITNKPNIKLQTNSLLIYNKEEIEELQKQRFTFPDFIKIQSGKLRIVNKFGKFSVFETAKNY